MLDLLTIQDVARILRTSRFFIYRKVESGEIPALKVGRLLRFDPAAIEKWLGQNWYEPKNLKPKGGKHDRS